MVPEVRACISNNKHSDWLTKIVEYYRKLLV